MRGEGSPFCSKSRRRRGVSEAAGEGWGKMRFQFRHVRGGGSGEISVYVVIFSGNMWLVKTFCAN